MHNSDDSNNVEVIPKDDFEMVKEDIENISDSELNRLHNSSLNNAKRPKKSRLKKLNKQSIKKMKKQKERNKKKSPKQRCHELIDAKSPTPKKVITNFCERDEEEYKSKMTNLEKMSSELNSNDIKKAKKSTIQKKGRKVFKGNLGDKFICDNETKKTVYVRQDQMTPTTVRTYRTRRSKKKEEQNKQSAA